ncbi:MAG: glycosyl transferase family 2 [Candidatus Anoxymicrobium japonicum]|uniref:Glycosyl transferase family 2 n=1 Tax=Candidatus Anoxymicrobium japonicum TaxID=2013648 RepID=A0A2N3G537_9ACTN|nr:MAG: glycosyl transferase family 2 [Candidatus Anoxymicrobium japonicum]
MFTINRVFGEQRIGLQDIVDSDLPFASVVIPMHNEEKVAAAILDLLMQSDYPESKLEIIPIDDYSTDSTKDILASYEAKFPRIKPLFRDAASRRGKAAALNDSLRIANGEIVIIFDADYLPPRGIIRTLAMNILDPDVGAAMGRVVPYNASVNLLTRLLEAERTGGYQVDQQARHNLQLVPQYGGTAACFKKDIVLELGGFNENILAEDTELTMKIFLHGMNVAYVNRAECYEEVPETWAARGMQIRRWSRGHNHVLFYYLIPFIRSKKLSLKKKIDGIFLLFIYTTPTFFILGLIDSIILFFLGEMNILNRFVVLFFVLTYNNLGTFAPYYELGEGALLDGATRRINLLPVFVYSFSVNMTYSILGLFDSCVDVLSKRITTWRKTERFASGGSEN